MNIKSMMDAMVTAWGVNCLMLYSAWFYDNTLGSELLWI